MSSGAKLLVILVFLHFQDEELLQDRGSIEPGADSAEAPRGNYLDFLFVLQ